jgi:hypothetical protein
VLEDMEQRYTEVARRHGFVAVDAGVPLERVHGTLRRMVDVLVAQRRPAATARAPGAAQDRPGTSAVAAGPESRGSRPADPAGEDRA